MSTPSAVAKPATSQRLIRWLIAPFSVEGKMRSNAGNWLELADKIFHYRRDELKGAELTDLQQKRETLRAYLRDGADASKLKLGIESLEGVLRRTGGKLYPRSTLQEYVEFFLVAAILIIGLRVFFVQPFKIPTNSMWPSYNGMTPHVYQDPADAPGTLAKLARLAAFGAIHKELVAPETGKIAFQVDNRYPDGRLLFERKPGHKWGVFPAMVREYTFHVGDSPVRLQVPEDFDFDWAFREAFGYTRAQLHLLGMKSRAGGPGFNWVIASREAEKGKPFISFDIMTGDMLFVDRISYHFVQPKVGDGFVFRTGNIPRLGQDQYYIKRLVGTPGDRLEIREPVLLRNGLPIGGAASFAKNARREGLYEGYFNGERSINYPDALLLKGQEITIPADCFLALGDNSGNSLDGRYWGYVPRKDVVGRPLFIYYPITSHWGLAR